MDLQSLEILAALSAENEYMAMNEEDETETQRAAAHSETESQGAKTHSETQSATQTVHDSNKRPKKSHVWKEFVLVGVEEAGKRRSRCIHCSKKLVTETGQGTSALKRHLDCCPKRPRGLIFESEYDVKVDRQMISEIIIYHDQPFKYVEYEKVRARDKFLNPNCQHICRQTARADVFRRYEVEKEKLKKLFVEYKGRLCFTADLWTARVTMMGYICLTAHYVDDDWMLNNKILAFCEVKPPHSGEELADKVLSSLKEWGLEKKVFTVTLDNATSNDSMQKILLHRLQMINEEEWDRGESLCDFLKPFSTITTYMSGVKYPTANVYFLQVWKIERLLKKYAKCGDSKMEEVAQSMQSKFDKYWDEYSIVLAMGAILDPRLKVQILKSAYDKVDHSTSEKKVVVVVQNLRDLYEDFKTKSWTSSASASTTQPAHDLLTESPLEDDRNLDLFELERSIQPGLNNTKSNLDLYLDEPRLDLRSFTDIEVLSYWKNSGQRYGDLASLASILLSIPITTVASESAFSVGGRVLNPYRNRLLPKNVQALLCTRNWLCGYAEFEGDIKDNFDDENEDASKMASSSGV